MHPVVGGDVDIQSEAMIRQSPSAEIPWIGTRGIPTVFNQLVFICAGTFRFSLDFLSPVVHPVNV